MCGLDKSNARAEREIGVATSTQSCQCSYRIDRGSQLGEVCRLDHQKIK